jgi:hypothetical protein
MHSPTQQTLCGPHDTPSPSSCQTERAQYVVPLWESAVQAPYMHGEALQSWSYHGGPTVHDCTQVPD